MVTLRYIETTYHYSCSNCGIWFIMSDPPTDTIKIEWYCPECGVKDKPEPEKTDEGY